MNPVRVGRRVGRQVSITLRAPRRRRRRGRAEGNPSSTIGPEQLGGGLSCTQLELDLIAVRHRAQVEYLPSFLFPEDCGEHRGKLCQRSQGHQSGRDRPERRGVENPHPCRTAVSARRIGIFPLMFYTSQRYLDSNSGGPEGARVSARAFLCATAHRDRLLIRPKNS
jgi:hypothetical protein